MASSLKTLIVPSKGKHTATVIFMHVCRHRVPSASTPDTRFLHRDWVILATAGSLWLINSRAMGVYNTSNGFSLMRE